MNQPGRPQDCAVSRTLVPYQRANRGHRHTASHIVHL